MPTRQTNLCRLCALLAATCGLALAGREAAAAPVLVDIKIIHAHNKGQAVDPKIQSLAKQLQKLNFTAYALKDEAVLNLEIEAAGRVQLPNGEWLVVKPLSLEADQKLKLELSVEKLKFKTTVAIAPGATLVVGGPAFDNGALIVAVSRPKT